MKADALNPRELFGTTVQYEIPSFQRPYVWSEEDQWAPLWQDVQRVAERVIAAGEDPKKLEAAGGHFLGAVVFKAKSATAGDVTRHSVIDGQQRTTTLQVLLDAVHEVVEELGHEVEAEALEELILNGSKRFAGKPERFKLWPSRSDRAAFEFAMDHTGEPNEEHLIFEAHEFFKREAHDWLKGVPDDLEPVVGDQPSRVKALSDVLQTRLYVVAINLTGHDDDQVIFETLNDRGTPLLKADLIKNWVFQIGETVHADVESWPETIWQDFDDTWWREEISQGRHKRSRIDIFLQYWLTMRTRDEVLTDEVFRGFMEYAKPLMDSAENAESLLGELRRDADTFRSFAQLSTDTVEGRFYDRVIEALELASTTPLLLWILSENHTVPPDQAAKALQALESWVIRRTLLRSTMKNVNQLLVAILNALDTAKPDQVGDVVEQFLANQTADSRLWPTDADVLAALPGVRLYGNVRQGRLRVVLEAIEMQLRTDKHENVSIPSGMQIEHVMPKGWRHYWDPAGDLSDQEASERDKLIDTIGNLTLINQKLNVTLSNRPWTDAEAEQIKSSGQDAGCGKRTLLRKYSLLVLSSKLVDEHVEEWTEQMIRDRSDLMSKSLCAVWPGPPASTPVEATPES